MNTALTFTSVEESELQSRLNMITSSLGFQTTLDKLITEWAVFVARLELGYDDSLYDYLDDLATRDLIQQVIDAISPALREKVGAAVQPWDERFERATYAVDESAQRIAWNGDNSWDRRLPNQPTGELASDLRSVGLVD